MNFCIKFHFILAPGKGRQSSSKSKTVADTSYICWHCGESLANLAEYKEHCNIHSSAVRVYTCDICQKKNHNICRLIGHLKGSALMNENLKDNGENEFQISECIN